ncbi:MAG: ABC transporter, partial [Gammaproteobacteria bacterium]|nr:ABC transporter [Gammaproteobacteria bacterium]
NLDTRTGENVIELLFSLNAEFATTLVLVTHDQRIADRCDRSIVMEGGTVVDTISASADN